MPDYYRWPGWRLVEALVTGEVAVEDYVASIYERIEKLQELLNAYITVLPREKVEKEARRAVEEARRGRKMPLAGLLLAVKDNICTRGVRTTCASKMLSDYVPPYNATVIERLTSAGAVVVGKTNLDEFAMGSTGETSAYGPARNPWDPSRVPGGSSSGTAVALAAGMATLGLGSDTGGSIRLPAAWTGVYGMKPTYGLVSRYGLVAYADSLEQIGPMARNIRDLAMLLEVMAGFDPHDSTTLDYKPEEGAYTKPAWEPRVEGMRVAVVVDLAEHPALDERVGKLVWKVADILSREGVEVGEVRLGRAVTEYALPAYYVIAMCEASSNLARYDSVRYGGRMEPRPWESWNKHYSRARGKLFGWEVKRRIMLGSWMLSAGYKDQYYVRALKLRRLVKESLQKSLETYNALLMPSAVSPPPKLGEVFTDPIRIYLLDLTTVPVNLAGVPALTLPVDYIEGIPIGVQLVGRILGEPDIIALARVVEDHTGMHDLIAEPPPQPT